MKNGGECAEDICLHKADHDGNDIQLGREIAEHDERKEDARARALRLIVGKQRTLQDEVVKNMIAVQRRHGN